MNGPEKDTGAEGHGRGIPVIGGAGVAQGRGKRDLVVDLSGIRTLDLANLSLLLTAQRKAEKEGRIVWLAGVPLQIWEALNAMGLGRFFRPFPVSGEVVV